MSVYIIEFERTKRKVRGGTLPVSGIVVSLRQSIFGVPAKTRLLAERFLEGTDALMFDGIAEHSVLVIHEGAPPERQGRS